MVQSLFHNVIEVTITTSFVIAALLLLLPLIHKKYAVKWRYWMWIVLAVRLLIPFSPSLLNTPIEITPPSQNLEFKVPVQNTMTSPLPNNTTVAKAAKNSTASRTITLDEILAIVWVFGIAVFVFYHLSGYFLFKRSVLRFSRPVEDKRATELWSEVKKEMNVGSNIQLLSCKKVQSPMMIGFFKPLLFLPDLDYSNTDLRIILKHELIHYKREDIWYKVLLVCANAVHWFNPLLYLMVALSNNDIEIVCDSEVIRDSNAAFRKQYSETILLAIHKGNLRRTAFSTYFYGGKKTMKDRFINIFDMSKKRKGMIAFLIVLVSVVLVGGIVAYDTQSAGNDVVSVVKKHLEAKKNNDYEAWKSTLWPAEKNDQNFTPSFEKPGDLGVISFTVKKVKVSDEETQRMKKRYTGSDLAKSYGWSDEYISENMIVVFTQYMVDYDNTKVPYNEGALTQDFILIRDDKDSPWLIWDFTSPSEMPLSGNNQQDVKTVDISGFGSLNIGATMPEIDYASKTRAIFHSFFGLFVYDMENQQIYRSVDLKAIDSNYMQGSTYTEVSVSRDGKTVYIENVGDGYDEFMYEYDVEGNTLTKTKVKKMSDRYVPGDISDKISPAKAGAASTTYGQINEDIYAYLLLDKDMLYTGDLKLVVYNEKDSSSYTYSIFKPSSVNESTQNIMEKFLNSVEGQNFQSTAKDFVKAYLSGDVKTMKSYLIDPESKTNYFNTKDLYADVKSLVLKLNPKDIKENSVIAEYEFLLKEEDSYSYLYLEMKKVNNQWKVELYGLEK